MSLIRKIKVILEDGGAVRRHRQDWEETGRSSRQQMGLMGQTFSRFKGILIGGLVSIGSALVAALSTKAAVAAAEFKKNFAQVDTLVDNTRVNIQKLERDLREMARNSTEDLNVLTQALYQLISAGVDATKAVDVLDTAVRAAAAGGTDVATAVDGITNAMNGFGIAAEKADDIADIFFIGVRNGKTTFGELSGSIGQTAALASTLGADLDEVIAASAALTLTGKTTSETMTQLSSAFTSMIKNSDEFKALGIDVKKVLAEEGFAGLVGRIAEVTGMSEEALAKLFPRLEGLTGIMSLAGNQSEAFAKNLRDMEDRAGATATAFSEVSDEAAHTAGLIGSRLKSAMITLGEGILNVANPALQGLLSLMESFDTPAEAMVRRLKEMGAAAEDIRIAQLHKAIEEAENAIERERGRLGGGAFQEVLLQTRGVRRGIEIPEENRAMGNGSPVTFPLASNFIRRDRGVQTLRGDVSNEELEEALKFNRSEAVRLSKEQTENADELVKRLAEENDLIMSILANRQRQAAEEESIARARAELRMLTGQELDASDVDLLFPEVVKPIRREDVDAAESEKRAREAVERQRQAELDAEAIQKAAERGIATAKRMKEALEDAMRIDAAPDDMKEFVEAVVQAERELAKAQEVRDDIAAGKRDTSEIDAVVKMLTEQTVEARLAAEGMEILSEEFQTVKGEVKATAKAFEEARQKQIEFNRTEPGGLQDQIEDLSNLGEALDEYARKQEAVETAKFSGDEEAVAEALIEASGAAADLQVIVADILEKWADKLPPTLRGPVLKAIRDINDETSETKTETEKAAEAADAYRKKMESIGDALDSVADAGRALLRMGDVFGFLSDKAREFAASLLDAVDNAGNLVKAIGSGDVFGAITSGAGLLVSVGGMVGSLFGGDDDERREQANEQRRIAAEQEEAINDLNEALRENASRIEDAIDRLIRSSIIGGDTTEEAVREGRRLLEDFGREREAPGGGGLPDPFTEDPNPPGDLTPEILEAFQTYLRSLQATGPGAAQGRGLATQALNTLLEGTGISIEDLRDFFGLNPDNVQPFIDDPTLLDPEDRDPGDLPAGLPGVAITPEEFRDLVMDMFEAGVISEAIRDALLAEADLLEEQSEIPGSGINLSEEFQRLIDEVILPALEALEEGLGTFSRTVHGAIRRFNTISSILGDSEAAIADFVKFITEPDETGVSLIDPNSEAGRLLTEFITADEDRRNEILDAIGAIIQDPERFASFLPDDMTPNDFLTLIGPLFGFRTPDEPGADDPAATFAGALTDAEAAVRRLTQLLGEDLIFAFDEFLDEVLKGAEHFDGELAGILKEARGLDLTTDAGRERLGEIVRALTESLMAGEFFGLEEDDFERLIGDLNRFATAEFNPQGFTRSVAIRREITEVKGNEVIIFLAGILAVLQIISRHLTGEKVDLTPTAPQDDSGGIDPSPPPFDDRPPSGDPTIDDMPIHSVAPSVMVEVPEMEALSLTGAEAPVINATIVNNFDIDIKADTVDEMLRQLENRVRDKSYRVFPQRV